jgi:hypothetical protein
MKEKAEKWWLYTKAWTWCWIMFWRFLWNIVRMQSVWM